MASLAGPASIMAGFFHRFYGWLLRMFWYVSCPSSLLFGAPNRSADLPRRDMIVFFCAHGSDMGQGVGNGRHHARAAKCGQNVDSSGSGGEYPGHPMLRVRLSSDRAN
jgi:hypothetical protein